MKAKFGIVVFPGSNCDHDAYYAIKKILERDAVFLWHKDKSLQNCDAVILPGGFSYGDYLRAGAIAKFSPIMEQVINFVEKGGYVIGICNGFQILTESGILPGALIKNNSLKFICKDVYLKTENFDTPFTTKLKTKPVVKIPIAHGEGNYFADNKTLEDLIKNNQIIFKYCSSNGIIDENSNPNGSLLNIAGIVNKKGNVLGMMPHPERVCDPILGNTDGQLIFKSLIEWIEKN